MRETKRLVVEEITCDIYRNEVDESDKKNITVILLKRSTEVELDVCKECYYDLEDYFRPIIREELKIEEEGK